MLIRLTIVLLFVISATALSAQEVAPQAVTKAVTQMTGFYQLTPEQAAAVEVILTREWRNVTEIAALRTSAPEEYLERMRAIRESTQATTRRLLSPAQRSLLQAANQRERGERGERYKNLQAQGLSAQEIELELTKQYLVDKGW